VIRTRVGYTGGTKEDPTYYSLGDHTETVQLDYDPTVTSYEDLLAVFFASHDPTYLPPKRQYVSAVFVHSAEQERLAREAVAREQERLGRAVVTEVMTASTFYLAEDYHQKYGLQGDRVLMADFRRMYPDLWDIVDSTAATRVNAYTYGCGSPEEIEAAVDGLGLSPEGRTRLLQIAQ